MENFKSGFIILITGSMFSGKTEELMRTLRRFEIAKKKVVLFKPEIDKRYDDQKVVSHNGDAIAAIVKKDSADIAKYLEDNDYDSVDIIGVDEAQFFDVPELTRLAKIWANDGKKVIIAALDQTFEAVPFPGLPELLAEAEVVKKLHAICMNCGGLASRTHRLSDAKGTVEVGGADKYQALCRHCFLEANKDR
ncbi:thymidine kinase [Candidatus Nomurabacteria bacterium]|nr:thymidine kinase [Candidatus Nomurabacteria bacterium]